MAEVARVYAEALFDVAKEKGKLDQIGEELSQFADTVDSSRDLQVFLFSPHFSSAEKFEGLRKGISGADSEFLNFLELLIEKRRMTEVFASDFSRARFASFEGATDADRAALNESVIATFQDHFWTRKGSIADLFTTTRFVVNPTE